MPVLSPDERKVQAILDDWDLNRLETDRQELDMKGWDEEYPTQGRFVARRSLLNR